MPESASPPAVGRPMPRATRTPLLAPEPIRTELSVSLEAGLEPLRDIRAGEKLRLWLEPGGGAGVFDVAVERGDGTPVGYLEPAISRRIGAALERSRRELWATVVEIGPGPDQFTQPRIAVEFRTPTKPPGGAPFPSAAVPTFRELVPTAAYPHPYPFPFFNPVQSAVFPLRGNGNNIIVSANTSAGKTIAAELLVDDTLARGRKVIYLSPFKALTEERYADWKKRYSDKRLAITTGDYELTPALQEELRSADIVVMTSEMMDSRTRKFESERNEWMRAVGLVVVDEAHILSTPRGDKVEVGLMRFTRFCPQARLMLLSATMSNRDEIGEWITSLNAMPTDVVYKDWRPVKLDVHYVEHREFRNFNGKLDYHRTEEEKIALALELVMLKPAEKFLVFVHTKKTGSRIVAELKKRGVKALYHNGDLDLAGRAAAESSFKNRANGTRVLVSTCTTAWGVNLPARNVVVVGVMRGLKPVDEIDIIQMAGRAGRYGIDEEGHVFLIVPMGSREEWEEIFRRPRPVTSVLNDHGRLVEHVLAEIYTGLVGRLSDVFTWYRRSLAHRQGKRPFSYDDIRKVVEKLISLDMIRIQGDQVAITALGAVSAVMYFPPEDIHAWRMNFNRLFMKGLEDNEHAVAWALADVPSLAMDYLPADFSTLELEWAAILSEHDLRLSRFNVPAALAVHACLMGAKPFAGIGTLAGRFWSDHLRILNALRMIDKSFAKWGREEFWSQLGLRLTRNKKKRFIRQMPGLRQVGG